MSATMVRPDQAERPVVEPSTDFPTIEDEVPVRWTRLWTAAIVGSGALVAGGAVGFVLGRVTAS